MARQRKASDADVPVLELPVQFSNVNIGDETARVGVSIGRSNLTVGQADKNFVGKRLTGNILARANGAQSQQGSLPNIEDDVEMDGVFDVHGFTASLKKISFGLTFRLASIDVTVLAKFAKRNGMLAVRGIEAIPEGEQEGEA